MTPSSVKADIDRIAYVELYVSNLFWAKSFFVNALKFKHLATRKENNLTSFLLKQSQIHLILTSPLCHESEIASHLNLHGDSAKKISFRVNDVSACFDAAIREGAKPLLVPQQKNSVFTASVEVFNGIEHEFLEINGDNRIPGFDYEEPLEQNPLLLNIDHIALCHPANTIEKWVQFYSKAFAFSENTNEDIYSEESGMHIIIMKSPNGKVNLPLVEPSSAKSPLTTYLDFNHGAGIHHIAFGTKDIIDAVKVYEQHAGELRKAMPEYYEDALQSYPHLGEKINRIAPYGIMLEQDEKGILFQIFTKPVVTRPTLFLEFIERDVCEGFGTVNIKALYASLES